MHKLALLILIVFLTGCSKVEAPTQPRLIGPPERIDESTPQSDNQIACAQDAKQCLDGSWVGRSGQKCEFICPPNKSK
ncbi:MAG: hypothetical protein WBL28_09435 [Methylotenera sp.]